jgi:N-methylhydantoinase A
MNWRVVSSGPKPSVRLRTATLEVSDAQLARKASRPAYFPEYSGYVDTPVYDRYALGPGAALVGPAIIEERESTMLVGPGGRAHCDEQLNLVVEVTADTPLGKAR